MTRRPTVVNRRSTCCPLEPRSRLSKEHLPRLVYMPSGNGEVHTQKTADLLSTNGPQRPRHHSRGRTMRPSHPSTSSSTTIDARWGQFRPSRWGQCKPSFPHVGADPCRGARIQDARPVRGPVRQPRVARTRRLPTARAHTRGDRALAGRPSRRRRAGRVDTQGANAARRDTAARARSGPDYVESTASRAQARATGD